MSRSGATTSSEQDYKQAAQTISDQIQNIVCFGSTNREPSRSHREKFNLLLKALNTLFNPPTGSTIYSRLLDDLQRINLLKDQSPFMKWTQNSRYIAHGSMIHYLPPAYFFNSKSRAVEIIKKAYPKLEWDNLSLSQLYVVIASYLRDFDQIIEVKKMLETKKDVTDFLSQEKRYLGMLTKEESVGELKEDRDLFFKKTMQYAKAISFHYGYGDCGHITDIAMLIAVSMRLPCAFVRFVSNKYEDLNVLALGQWPNPGCVIVDKWQNRIFMWQGTVKKTTEVASYDKAVTVIAISDPQELAYFKKILDEDQFESWLESPVRKDNLAKIKKFSEIFYSDLQSTHILKQTPTETKEAKPAMSAETTEDKSTIVANAIKQNLTMLPDNAVTTVIEYLGNDITSVCLRT